MASHSNTHEIAVPEFLSGGGKMGKLIRSKDWSNTPLGSPDTWPQSLRTTVSLCIASNFPISITWGPHRVQIYNDGYWPITGDKHPASMGQDFKACWLSAWPVIGQAFEEASLGQTRFLENQRIFIDRYGYLEETFFTFSFSPILDESGGVGGLFHPVIELTQQTIAERRLNILRVVADKTVNARTVEEASSLIMECLKDFELDLPFVLLYRIAADGKEANLQGNVGFERDSPLAPDKIKLEVNHHDSWPFTEVIQNGKAVQVEELRNIFGTFNCGPYAEAPQQAMVFSITLHGTAHNNYFLVAGVSSRRRLDEKYLLFFELLAASVTNVLTKARAYEEERKKAEALAEIDKAKTVFFSNISHEFRTPLTLMLSPLEELLNQKKNNFSESDKQNIETTHRNAMRLLKLVNTLLDFSRIESGRQEAMFSLVDIVALTKNLAANFRSVIEKAGLKLIIKADTFIQPVHVDKQMWEKIVFNLLSNAFKYTLEGKIIVELSAEKDFAVLKVKDTGVGIPENELPKMFERFHRVQNVTGRTYEGTGIGLSLIKELVQMHHGTIDVESKLNDGSVFTVKIPFGKDHLDGHWISNSEIDSDEISSNIYVEEIKTLLESQTKESLKPSSVKEKNILVTVLVVDDNADMREHISSILSNNFNVITANNGLDAMHKLKETIPALVLSDIMMPVMDGIGLLKEIKSNKTTENIPVIFLTARAGEESRIEGLETGADDYLVKPFSAKELVARVMAQIKIVKLRKELEGNVRNLFLEAPAIICVLRGPQHVFELANDMYLQLIGNRDILGKPIRKALPEGEGQGLFELLDNVYSTGERFIGNELPSKIDKGNGKLEEVYFNYVYQPSHNSEGETDGILVHGVDVTEQVLARKKIEESEKQQAFLLKLSDALRSLSNPVDIEEAVTKIAMEFMDADRCHYSTIEEDNVIILRDALRGDLPSLIGVYSLRSFALFKTLLTAGHPFIVEDVNTTEIIDEELKQLCLQMQNISFINVPVIKNGKPVGLLSLVQSKPRKWTDSEVQLTIETAERSWAAVERAKAEEALRKSEEKYRTLFDSIDEGFNMVEVLFDDKGKAHDYIFLEMNRAHEAMSGVSHTVAGMRVRELMLDIEESFLERMGKVALTGEGTRYEQYVSALNRWFDVYTLRVGGNGSRIVASIFNNITERKQAEEKIKESESRFRTMADASPVLIWTIEANGLSSYYNKTFLDFIGVSKIEDISDWEKIVHPVDVQATFDTINTAIAERRSYSLECRLLRADGHWRWVMAQGNPRMGDNNEFLGFVGSSVDITERKQAEEKIIESESRFRILADQSPMIVYLVEPDAAATMSYFNKSWLDYTGQTFEDAIGRAWNGIVHPDDLQEVLDIYVPAFLERTPYTLPAVRLRRHDGEYRWHLFKSNPRYFHTGEFIGFVGVGFDVHEQKIIEEKLEALVNERTQELQRSNEDLQQFAHVASHDLKEPVRKIRTFGNRLTQEFGDNLPEKAKTYLAKMQSAATRMYAMIDGVLLYSSLEARDQTTETIDLNEVFSQIESDLEVMITLKRASIQFNKLSTVEGSPILIYQLFYNLIYNSLKFSKPDTPPIIEITTERKEDYVSISVKDNGIGFSQDEGEKIFKTFFRLHPKDLYEGTGLGLALCKKIVERHGGTISATGVENEGAIFEIIFSLRSSGDLI